MVPFDVMAGGDCVINNSGSVTHVRWGLKMLDLSVMQSSHSFADAEDKPTGDCFYSFFTIVSIKHCTIRL